MFLFQQHSKQKKAIKENIDYLLDSDDDLVSNNKWMASVLSETYGKVFAKENNRVSDLIKYICRITEGDTFAVNLPYFCEKFLFCLTTTYGDLTVSLILILLAHPVKSRAVVGFE